MEYRDVILSLSAAVILLACTVAGMVALAFSQRGRNWARRVLGRPRRPKTPAKGGAASPVPAAKPLALTRERLTGAVVEGRMMLDPDLKIGDLLLPLGTNRTYLSNFINSNYGTNFRGFINRCRIEELGRLAALPGNKGKNIAELVPQAGFGSYRSYLRARREAAGDAGKSEEAANATGGAAESGAGNFV